LLTANLIGSGAIAIAAWLGLACYHIWIVYFRVPKLKELIAEERENHL
jgi:hypothetical protein